MVDKQDGELGIGDMKGDIGGNARISGVSNENCTSAKMNMQSSVNGAAGNVQRNFIVNNNHYYNSSHTPEISSSKKVTKTKIGHCLLRVHTENIQMSPTVTRYFKERANI